MVHLLYLCTLLLHGRALTAGGGRGRRQLMMVLLLEEVVVVGAGGTGGAEGLDLDEFADGG